MEAHLGFFFSQSKQIYIKIVDTLLSIWCLMLANDLSLI